MDSIPLSFSSHLLIGLAFFTNGPGFEAVTCFKTYQWLDWDSLTA